MYSIIKDYIDYMVRFGRVCSHMAHGSSLLCKAECHRIDVGENLSLGQLGCIYILY